MIFVLSWMYDAPMSCFSFDFPIRGVSIGSVKQHDCDATESHSEIESEVAYQPDHQGRDFKTSSPHS